MLNRYVFINSVKSLFVNRGRLTYDVGIEEFRNYMYEYHSFSSSIPQYYVGQGIQPCGVAATPTPQGSTVNMLSPRGANLKGLPYDVG